MSADTELGGLACDRCVARSWLLSRLGGHLEHARGQIDAALALDDEELIAAVGGRYREQVARELGCLDAGGLRERAAAARIDSICRCQATYPARLRALGSPPAVLYVAGGLTRFLEIAGEDPVAIVGARKASPYGIEVARSLGQALGRSGVTVISGMAFGIDSAAHAGALSAGAPTIAVLPGPADRSYPASQRALHRQIVGSGAAISELPPGASVWRDNSARWPGWEEVITSNWCPRRLLPPRWRRPAEGGGEVVARPPDAVLVLQDEHFRRFVLRLPRFELRRVQPVH